jgi:hypothetical protein
MLDSWYGNNNVDISFCNCLLSQNVSYSHGSSLFHSVSMLSYNLDTCQMRAASPKPKEEVIVWKQGRKSNRIIFKTHVVYTDINGNMKTINLTVMADTGATCSVFDCVFVERNEIPW